ncbi:MAG: type II secretion system protein GspJ [Gemmatimonadota bacterium]
MTAGRPARRAIASRAGFTLLELLLAFAIFATVLVLLVASFTGAERAREILSDRSHGYRQIRAGLDRIGTDLSGAFASDGAEGSALTLRTDTLSGKTAATLVFTAFSLPEPGEVRPATDIVKVKYSARLGPDGTFLSLFREQSDLPLIENRIPTREVRIAERLLAFKVEAWDGAAWAKDWPSGGRKATALPTKVALVLTDAGGTEYRRVVPLVLAGQEATVLFSGKRGAR